MRLMIFAAAASITLSPLVLHAQTTPAAPAPAVGGTMAPPPTTAPATAPAAPATSAAPSPAAPVKHGKRQTLQQHFDAANTTHDGHLTKDQATASKWGYVTKHFDAIDKDHKGYVTVDDIHAYAHAMHTTKAAHKAKSPVPPATTTN